MKHEMFSVFDVKAQAYLPPFVLPSEGMAVRIFGDCVNSSDHQFGKHPGDYTLFRIGSFDDSVCVVSCTPSALKVVNGLEVVISDPDRAQRNLDFVGDMIGADAPGAPVLVDGDDHEAT